MTPPQSRQARARAVAAYSAGYAAWDPTHLMTCPYGREARLEQLWWIRGWLARLKVARLEAEQDDADAVSPLRVVPP